ncbi:conserved hypothetical protein [Gloeothece citriformis PCC 7424]|uniref:Uncharacterized protein n=1 Tax=Gloeothece citriformis (strain PCC 7424) TaxID=65393 RepID=B7KFF7_GLOC7|nr:hypothetical protein [Gloeothece citriformis]ACK71873.1 conserved hypothetical protein [Gloeothece citriformis PCC 7424]
MTSSSQNEQNFNPLGKLASLIALLAIALYFTGWIYRWSYFGFFQIEVTTLNLPLESFYLAAFQALFGHPLTILRTIIAFIVACILIVINLKFIDIVKKIIDVIQKKWKNNAVKIWKNNTLQILNKLNIRKKYLIKLNPINPSRQDLIKFLVSLIDELVIVFLALAILFLLAYWQGDEDAWKDVVNETSRLPVITVAIPDKNAALGRKLNDLSNPSDFRIIGAQSIYDKLLGQELSDSNQSRVWRLLIDRDGYFYIFPALPKKDQYKTVPVLIIYKSGSGDQLTIISSPQSWKNLP